MAPQLIRTTSSCRPQYQISSKSFRGRLLGNARYNEINDHLITLSQPLMLLLAVFIYDPLTESSHCSSLPTFGSRAFVTLARQSGTRCKMNLEITTVFMALNDSWKQFFLAVTGVTSVLEIFLWDVLHKSTFYLHTYILGLLTYLVVCQNRSKPNRLIFVYVSKKEKGHLQYRVQSTACDSSTIQDL